MAGLWTGHDILVQRGITKALLSHDLLILMKLYITPSCGEAVLHRAGKAECERRPASMIKQVAWVSLLFFSAFSAHGADQKHLACISDYGIRSLCKNTNVFFHCRANLTRAQMGNAVCHIRSETGVQYYPSEVKPGRAESGGMCGARIADIYCRNMPDDSNVRWHVNNCVGEDQRNCPPNTKFFECGVSAEGIARSYCTKDGLTTPYQVFKYSDRPGGRCGYAAFVVGCHFPAN